MPLKIIKPIGNSSQSRERPHTRQPSCGPGAGSEIFLLFLIILGTVLSAGYAIKKTIKSIANIFQGKKIAKSLIRISGASAGAIGGAKAGGIVGTLLFPGIGTMIGMVFGACLGAGIGTIIGKYSGKLMTAIRTTRTDISRTNPQKYRLKHPEIEIGVNRTTEQMLRTLRYHKNKESRVSQCIPAGYDTKIDIYNAAIRMITDSKQPSKVVDTIKTGYLKIQLGQQRYHFGLENPQQNLDDQETSFYATLQPGLHGH